ncbi:hypothetical protein ACFRJ3_11145 [Streptomyces sp. NPDC056696]|uniref:hypothetical protein n=1 Tax=Streptomyces sp. NPDC056696 TaxID=3345914 RepID=UPI00369C8371
MTHVDSTGTRPNAAGSNDTGSNDTVKHAIRAPAPPGLLCNTTDHASPDLNSRLCQRSRRPAPCAPVVNPSQTSFSGFAWAGPVDGCTGSSRCR